MFKKWSMTLLVLLALVASTFAPALAAEVSPVEPLVPAPIYQAEGMVNETASMWFVELSSPPTIEGASPKTLAAEKKLFRDAAKQAGLQYSERMAFDTLWNGISINMDVSQLGKLSRLPRVKAIYPVDVIAMPQTVAGEIDPELSTALAMTGADVAQSELGFTGAGIKVAVMDTGIDVNHPDLGGNGVAELNSTFFFSSPRVKYGWDFVGDAFNADPASPLYNPIPVPDNNPDDCGGHGTHVSGIVGANGVVKGVAPEVTFGAYRVFGCNGSTTSDIMVAAMERALADGMQILNMSIGSAYQWPQYPTAVAATRLVNAGMVVVASIGNSGANGLYSAGAPGLGEKVIGVASFDNSHVFLPYFTVNARNNGYLTMTFSAPPPLSGSAEIVYIGRACNIDTLLANPSGKVALAVRGDCSFAEKALKAINAGATAVVIHNNIAGVVSGTLGAPLGSNVPVVGISLADGLFIRAQAAPVTMTWTNLQDSFPSPTGGLISSFSSYGLSPDLALKPDIGAPGGNIYSTYPLELGGYATLGGTSMASPHVAGAAALLLQAKPNTPSQIVRTILQNSADPKNWWGNPGLGFLDNVHRQGAGMLDIDDAILSTTKIEPGKIATGESEMGPYTQVISIENKSNTPVTYALSFVNALSTGANTFTPSFSTSNAIVAFSVPSVTVPGKGTATITATITPPTGPVGGQYGGYIVFTPQGVGQVYRVPFAGFIGDYQAKQVLTSGGYGMPWLSVLYAGSYYQMTDPTDWTFTMQGSDIPYILAHFDHQSRLVKMEVFDAISGKAWHVFVKEEYMPRNSSATGFYAFPFDGITTAGNKTYTVPDGTYIIKLSLLKANGDATNPLHWEYWTSPAFVIDRP